MMDFLLQPIKGQASLPLSFSSTSSSSRRTSLSSSRPNFRPIHSEIIRRKLVTDFLEATSVPVNVPIHRSRSMSEKMVVTSSLGDSSREEEGEEWLLSFKKCKKK